MAKRRKLGIYLTQDKQAFVLTAMKQNPKGGVKQAVIEMCKEFGFEFDRSIERAYQKLLKGPAAKTESLRIEDSDEYKEALSRDLRPAKYYLITWAQAETPIHKTFWENMQAYAEHIGAEIIVQPSRYKSPTSLEASKRLAEKEKNKNLWAPELRGNLYATRLHLNDMVAVLSDVKVQPTAVIPISNLNGFTGDKTSILPHPKVQLKSLPVLRDNPHKLVMSTGAVTLPNYTETKAGAKGAFEHELGFVIVEILDDKKFFVRQVQANDSGTFYDLHHRVSYGKVRDTRQSPMPHYPAAIFGDLHFGDHDPEAVNLAIEIVRDLGVSNVFLHDIANMHSISHHDLKSPLTMLQKEISGRDDLSAELDLVISNLAIMKSAMPETRLHVVASNHPLWLDKWLDSNDWRKSQNKAMYIKLLGLMAEGKGKDGILNYLINQEIPDIDTYNEDDSLKLKGWEMLIHGHIGASGSRGGIQQFKNLSTKVVSAHTHSPERQGGSVIAGTLTKLQLDYTKGLSSWMQGIVLMYATGKCSHIHFIDGKFTSLK